MKVTIYNKIDGSVYDEMQATRLATRTSTTLHNTLEYIVYKNNESKVYSANSFDIVIEEDKMVCLTNHLRRHIK